jgi:hypothetical protein
MVPVKREGELDVWARDAIKAGEEMVRVAHGAHRIAVTGGCVNGVRMAEARGASAVSPEPSAHRDGMRALIGARD